MTGASTVITPPLQPIVKKLRTRADLIDISVQYTHEGELVGEVSYISASNGSKGRLGRAQTATLLAFVEQHGLRPLVTELSRFGTAVRW